MDLAQLIFPFIMAVITSSVMIVLIYVLRKIPYFSNLFSLWFVVALYLVGVLRLLLPIEFPDIQVIIRDRFIYSFLINGVVDRAEDSYGTPSAALYIILGVWAAVSITLAVVSVSQYRSKRTYYLANYDFSTKKEQLLFRRIADQVLGSHRNVEMKMTDAVDTIKVIGYARRYILLPEGEYSTEELEVIFLHECTHLKNKDLLIKLLVHIYCCIFWWNPFAYLLKHDLDFTLEMRCDLSATKDFSDDEREKYITILSESCRKNAERNAAVMVPKSSDGRRFSFATAIKRIGARMKENVKKNYFFVYSEPSDGRKNKEMTKRFKAITADPPKKVGLVAVNALVSLVMAAIFALSYVFILQPFYGLPDDETDFEAGDIVADGSNCYLVRQADGSYLFYFLDYPPEVIPAEEFDEEMFKGYPILED